MALKAAIVALLVAAPTVYAAGAAFAASPFTLTLDKPVSVVNQVATATGTADSPAGEKSGNYVIIDWGDGATTQLPDFTTDGPWIWGPEVHTYADAGNYTITATLYHANINGQDQSQASDSSGIVVPPPPCTTDCPPAPCTTDCPPAPCTTDCPPAPCTTNCTTVVVSGATKVTKPAPKATVKGISLAHTGSASTQAALLGSMLLLLGMATRLRRRTEDLVHVMDAPVDTKAATYLSRYNAFLQSVTKR